MTRFSHVLIASTLAAVATPTLSHATVYNLITMTELVQVFQSAGYTVSTTSNSEVLQVGNSFVWLTDCRTNGRCAEISFFQNYGDVRPPLSKVNEWNNTKKIPEASINGNGTLHMELWLSAVGATDTSIIDTLGWFERYTADVDFWRPYISSQS